MARDYVSGAMENTSATLHGESVQKTARELLDDNQESTIAHELFHQWFGDYVTAESWSNLTMNESFDMMKAKMPKTGLAMANLKTTFVLKKMVIVQF